MNSKRMAKNKHRHKKANAAAVADKRKAGGRKKFASNFKPESASSLTLKSGDKHLILEALDELYALRSAREERRVGTVCWLMGRRICLARKKPKPRKKQGRSNKTHKG